MRSNSADGLCVHFRRPYELGIAGRKYVTTNPARLGILECDSNTRLRHVYDIHGRRSTVHRSPVSAPTIIDREEKHVQRFSTFVARIIF